MKLKTLLFLLTFSGALVAGPLVGNATLTLLPMAPNTGATPPGIAPTITQGVGSFSGVFAAPAPAEWQGTFNGTGSYPCCSNSGTSSWDFTLLPNGSLPSGTFMRLGDVDISETLILAAFGPGNTPITSFWLDEPSWVTGSTPGDFLQSNLPSFTFINGVYTFTGASNNTLLTIAMQSNVSIYRLEVTNQATNGFIIAAPEQGVPEPGTYALMGVSLGAVALYRRYRTV